MPLSKIKNEFLKHRIAFGDSAKPLGERDDIDQLAIIAHESKDGGMKKFFEHLPSLADLKKAKTDVDLKKSPSSTLPQQSAPAQKVEAPKATTDK